MITETRSLNGQPFHYRAWGRAGAPLLLMLHGFPEYSGAWDELAQRLAPHFHCIAPDQRGYGQSWAPEGAEHYRPHLLASDMAALIAHLSPKAPVMVLGHDWGASVAYALAIMQPALVSRLIIANGVHPACFQRELCKGGAQAEASQYIHSLRSKGSEERLAKDDFAGLMRLFSAKMDLSWLTPDKAAEYRAEWARPGRLRAMIDWYRATPLVVPRPGEAAPMPEMPAERFRVSMPHLVLWGMGDTALLPACLEGLESYAPDLTLHRIEGADHWIAHQKPDALARHILDWVAG